MKLGLLGDIHGNHLALIEVLSAATSMGVERLLITGDLIGYYHYPLRVIELLRPWAKYVVRGNHEDMLIAARNDPEFLAQTDRRYGTGLRAAIEQLSDPQLDELCSLPHPLHLNIDGCDILLCHGAPWDANQYVYPDAPPDLLNRCAADCDVVVLGHTHHPMNHRIDKTLIVNPGSVGQARNSVPGASWAIFDTDSHELKFRNERYDTAPLVEECKLRHPELPYLSEVLLRK